MVFPMETDVSSVGSLWEGAGRLSPMNGWKIFCAGRGDTGEGQEEDQGHQARPHTCVPMTR